MKLTEEALLKFLKSLGRNGSVVLRSLRAQGCHGERKSKDSCPLSCAVRSHFDNMETVVTDSDAIFAESDEEYVVLPLPPGCREFVHRYDAGQYRELRP